MKRKLYIIIPIIIIVIALFLAVIAALGLLFFSGNEPEVGRIVICEGEDDVFVDKNGQFWVMKETSPLKARLGELKTGDKILVYRISVKIRVWRRKHAPVRREHLSFHGRHPPVKQTGL